MSIAFVEAAALFYGQLDPRGPRHLDRIEGGRNELPECVGVRNSVSPPLRSANPQVSTGIKTVVGTVWDAFLSRRHLGAGRRSAPAVSLSRLQGDLVHRDELGRRRHSHAAHPLEEPDQRDFLRSGCHLRHHHGAAHRRFGLCGRVGGAAAARWRGWLALMGWRSADQRLLRRPSS